MSDCNSTYDPDSPLLWNRRFTSSGGEDVDILVGGVDHSANHTPLLRPEPWGSPQPQHPAHQ